MKTGEQVSATVKPWFDRFAETIKVVGSGNTAGLVGMVAAMNTIQPDHIHTVILLKPTAVIFALGIFLFGLAYLVYTYAWIYAEHYAGLIDPKAEQLPDTALRSKDASIMHMKRSVYFTIASAFCFFVGFVTAAVALIRY